MIQLTAAACLLAAGALAAPDRPAKGGSCVPCHDDLKESAELRHTFADWAKSRHAEVGTGCETCHGGDPAESAMEKAHKGMLPSSESRSKVYFTRIPGTCGGCHAKELAAFKRSAHYRELRSSGHGPNCVTCHGSMANHVLEPKMMEMTCTLCHRKPTQAYAAVLSLGNSGAQIDRLKRAVAAAKKSGMDTAAQEKELAELERLHDGALVDWHTFRIPAVLRISQAVARRAGTAVSELELKEKAR